MRKVWSCTKESYKCSCGGMTTPVKTLALNLTENQLGGYVTFTQELNPQELADLPATFDITVLDKEGKLAVQVMGLKPCHITKRRMYYSAATYLNYQLAHKMKRKEAKAQKAALSASEQEARRPLSPEVLADALQDQVPTVGHLTSRPAQSVKVRAE